MAATRITFNHNGSIRVEGDFELIDGNGEHIDVGGLTRVSLCRCGHSANKPFCDATHKQIGFASMIVAAQTNPPRPKPAT
ncbi:MAG TPA: CDGSH iron-sulfur domain-containing protein [Candidatus Acidoferrales bacterium]|nr:CDGSH iron-sulfur domain-containing protein [Candidatus Acidoferrales bacterium]